MLTVIFWTISSLKRVHLQRRQASFRLNLEPHTTLRQQRAILPLSTRPFIANRETVNALRVGCAYLVVTRTAIAQKYLVMARFDCHIFSAHLYTFFMRKDTRPRTMPPPLSHSVDGLPAEEIVAATMAIRSSPGS